jgi:hypothetical protein
MAISCAFCRTTGRTLLTDDRIWASDSIIRTAGEGHRLGLATGHFAWTAPLFRCRNMSHPQTKGNPAPCLSRTSNPWHQETAGSDSESLRDPVIMLRLCPIAWEKIRIETRTTEIVVSHLWSADHFRWRQACEQFLRFGDVVQIKMQDAAGYSVFGVIELLVQTDERPV